MANGLGYCTKLGIFLYMQACGLKRIATASLYLASMRVIIAPDKFKESLSSLEVCQAISAGIHQAAPGVGTISFPMADGGDGFAAVLQRYLHTHTVSCQAADPLGRPLQASYQWQEKDQVAIIEMAVASGMALLSAEERDPGQTSSYGTGLLIRDALARGARQIILGLGGSATNDGGAGILTALGFKLYDRHGASLSPEGNNLLQIHHIEPPASLPSARFDVACDVENILYGENGAAYIYAPQKGADPAMAEALDQGLRNWAFVLQAATGKDIAEVPGTGAAGGVAASLLSYFDAHLVKGIELVVKASGMLEYLPSASLLITGEGKIDEQSSEGKVVGSMARLAAQHGIPCIAFCGRQALGRSQSLAIGLSDVVAIDEGLHNKQQAIRQAASLLQQKAAAWFSEPGNLPGT